MVLDDIFKDYEKLMKLVYHHNTMGGYINMAIGMIGKYQKDTTERVDEYLNSVKDYTSCASLGDDLQKLQESASKEIAKLNYGIRSAIQLVTEIEKLTFTSTCVRQAAELVCEYLNSLIDATAEYVENKITGENDEKSFFKLIDLLKEFDDVYGQLCSDYQFLLRETEEVQGALPPNISEDDEIHYLDIRSAKSNTDLYSFADDLKLLTDSLISLEMLAAPGENHTIFIRKIESGSLKAEFGSKKIELSFFRDLVESLSNAIRSWRLIPSDARKNEAEANRINAEADKVNAEAGRASAEADKIRAEAQLMLAQAQAQRIQNEGTRLAIARTQIDYVCDKLKLNPDDPEKREQIERLCLSTVKYLEQNPVGSIDGVGYDITKEVGMLEGNGKAEI